MLELFGLTPEQIAENETWDSKKQKRTKDLCDRIGDGVMSILTGTNYGQRVQEATKGQYVDNLEDIYGSSIDDVSGVTGYDQIGDLSRLTDRKLEQEIAKRERTKSARSKAAATTGQDRSEFTHITDPGEIVAHASRLTKTENERKEGEERDRVQKETERKEGRIDSRYRDSQDLLMMQMSNQAADRQADREYRRDQQAYQNRKLDMQEARLDRKDRQAYIQQLMAGLSTIGASIAI